MRDQLERHGHRRVLVALDAASPACRDALLAQLLGLDFAGLAAAFARQPTAAEVSFEPSPVWRLPERGGDPRPLREAKQRGEAALAAGQVAAVVVAGGQGTRLGFPGPKGAFPIGPVSGRSLFALQAQKLAGLRRRYARPVPWYVMTSHATDSETRSLFTREVNFGLPGEDVFFLRQREVPCLDLAGELMLSAPDRLATSPDGHGGVLAALRDSGALADLNARGVTSLFYSQIDNPLVRLCDPALVGFQREADVACKVVEKRERDERVGTLALRDGRTHVIEYSEVREPQRSQPALTGGLAYWAGSIGTHCFDVAFLARCAPHAEALLPYHLAVKRIPVPEATSAPNGFKLERFVFDLLPHAQRVVAVEALREDEYAPLKNAAGSESPESVRAAMSACYRRWLAAAKIETPASATLEIDHAWADGPEDLIRTGLRSAWEDPGTIAIKTGGAP